MHCKGYSSWMYAIWYVCAGPEGHSWLSDEEEIIIAWSSVDIVKISLPVQRLVLAELSTPILDDMFSYLWIIAKKSRQHIDTLHVQMIKGRKIVITEDPQHLVLRHMYQTVAFLSPESGVLVEASLQFTTPAQLQ